MTTYNVSDRGPWTVDGGGQSVSSGYFKHDVVLRISGDFADINEEYAYAQWLADRLNGAVSAE